MILHKSLLPKLRLVHLSTGSLFSMVASNFFAVRVREALQYIWALAFEWSFFQKNYSLIKKMINFFFRKNPPSKKKKKLLIYFLAIIFSSSLEFFLSSWDLCWIYINSFLGLVENVWTIFVLKKKHRSKKPFTRKQRNGYRICIKYNMDMMISQRLKIYDNMVEIFSLLNI